MTWTIDNSKNDESSKIRWETVPYFHGRVLDIGCGAYKTFPHWVGVDNGHHWGLMGVDEKIKDAGDLSIFSGQSCDAVFSSHLLEHIEYDRIPDVLTEWMRVTKQDGHLMLYLPDENQYPKCGEKGANPDHKWDVSYEKVIAAMEQVKRGWDLIDYQVRRENDEYSLWFVFKLIQGREHKFSYKLPFPEIAWQQGSGVAIVMFDPQSQLSRQPKVFSGFRQQH